MIGKIERKEDIEECIDLYLKYNYEFSLPYDRTYLIRFATMSLIKRCPVFVYRIEKEIVAFILAQEINSQRVAENLLSVQVYGSKVFGFKGAKILVALHEELFKMCSNKVKMVRTSSSEIDEKYNLVKILEKHGWKREGYVAYKRYINE